MRVRGSRDRRGLPRPPALGLALLLPGSALLVACDRDPLDATGSNFCAVHAPGEPNADAPFAKGGASTPSFRDATDDYRLPRGIHSIAASVADLNGDGQSDIVVWDKDARGLKEAYMLCGRRYVPLGLARRIADLQSIGDLGATASAIRDLDADGRADIVLGTTRNSGPDVEGGVVVLFQGDQLRFSPTKLELAEVVRRSRPASIAAEDLDGDGRLDLYVSMRLRSDMPQMTDRAPNPILVQTAPRTFVDRSRAPEFAPLFDCGNNNSAAASFFVGPADAGRFDHYLWIGNLGSRDCLFRYRPGAGAAGYVQLELQLMQWLEGFVGTMGVDVGFRDDTGHPVIHETDWGTRLPTFEVTPQGVMNRTEQVKFAPLPEGTRKLIGWGFGRRDFDGDGDEDLLVANGSYFTKEAEPEFFFNDPPGDQRLQLYLNDGNEQFSNASATAGDVFLDHSDTYSVAIADVNRDGCYDAIVGPRALQIYVAEVDEDEFTTDLRILLNDCGYPSDRVGLLLPPGARLVKAEGRFGDGNGGTRQAVKFFNVRADAGVASSSDARRLLIGLGAGGRLDRVTVVVYAGGQARPIDVDGAGLRVNAYNDLSGITGPR